MKKRRVVSHMMSGRLIADACPNCGHELSGVTGARLDAPFDRIGPTRRVSLKGNASMCVYCGAMLVFADEEGHVRVMTAAERSSYRLDPVLESIISRLRAKIPDFTKKSYN